MLSLSKSNQSVSVCMPNNLDYQQDWISSTLGGSSQLTQGKATPSTVLLLSYSKQVLLLSCIPRHHPSTLCISPTSPAFLCQPSFCGVQLTTYQWYNGTFLLQGWCPTHQSCWPLAFWQDAWLSTCPVLSIMPGLSKLMLAGGNPQHFIETITITMPLPNPSLFVS